MTSAKVKFASVNVNGLATVTKRYQFGRFLKQHKVQVCAIQETHKKRDSYKLLNFSGWDQIYEARGTNKARGVALLIHNTVNFVKEGLLTDSEGRFVFVKGVIGKLKITFASIYGPNCSQIKFLKKTLSKLRNFAEGDVVIGSDFNWDFSKHPSALNLDDWNLINLNQSSVLSDRSTFYSYRHRSYSCIDYILVGRDNITKSDNFHKETHWVSDHAPLWTTLDLPLRIKPRKWCYDPAINNVSNDGIPLNKHISEFFEHNRNGQVTEDIVWDAFKASIRGECISREILSRRLRNDKRKQIIQRLEHLEVERQNTKTKHLRKPIDRAIKDLKAELDYIDKLVITKKLQFWRCLDLGQSSKALRRLSLKLKRKHKDNRVISQILTSQGKVSNDPSDIEVTLTQFFQKLYSAKQTKQPNNLSLSRSIDDQERDFLTSSITAQEILNVIKKLNKISAPGPDGFTYSFYKIFSSDLVPQLVVLFNYILEKNRPPPSWASGEVLLFLKKGKNAINPASYRPITLTNTDYKIFMRIMANRLKEIVPHIISLDQYGFMPGRQIEDPIRNLYNILFHSHNSHLKLAFLKLDVIKAFDSLDHTYLFSICQQYNLGPKFVLLLQNLYKDNVVRLNINGNLSQPVCIRSGTKQGCPLSPLLFIIAINPLIQLIYDNHNISGYTSNGIDLKLGMYADDFIGITDSPLRTISELQPILSAFKDMSGLEINLDKSDIMLRNCRRMEADSIRALSNIKIAHKSFRYLGVFIRKNPKNITQDNYNRTWRNILLTLSFWKDKFWSITHKIQIFRSFLFPKLLFLFRTVPLGIPSSVLKKWDRSVRKWIFGKSMNRFPAYVIYSKKSDGGWGVPNLALYFEATQVKRLLELEFGPEKRWTLIEKKLNSIEHQSLLTPIKNQPKSKLLPPLTTSLRIWNKWAKSFSIPPDLYNIATVNTDHRFDGILSLLEEADIRSIQQFTDLSVDDITNAIGRKHWLLIRGLKSEINSFLSSIRSSHSDILLNENISLSEIIQNFQNGEKVNIGQVYLKMLDVKFPILNKLKKLWSGEVLGTDLSIKDWIARLSKTRNSRTWEMNIKFMTKWYLTPAKLYKMGSANDNCWHCAKAVGNYEHMWWSCMYLQQFWQDIVLSINLMSDNFTIVCSKQICLFQDFTGLDNDLSFQSKYICQTLLRAAMRTIAAGWKDRMKWTVSRWLDYSKEEILFDVISDKLHPDKNSRKHSRTDIWRNLIFLTNEDMISDEILLTFIRWLKDTLFY